MHSTKRVDNPVCKECGSSDDLLKDKKTSSGYRSSCNPCNRKRQRINRNGYDTGDLSLRERSCRDCGEKDISKLCPDKNCRLGVKNLCKSCGAKRMQAQRNKPHSKHKENKRNSNKKLRIKVLEAYGNKCVICGEKHYEFLAIDHVNDNGAEHRRSIGDGNQVLREIIKENYPNTYQILCHNCNNAKGFYKRNPILIERYQKELTEGYMGEGI